MKILVIGGNGMQVTNGSLYWSLGKLLSTLGHETRLRECCETGLGADRVSIDDVSWADGYVVYSYGCASLWNLWHELQSVATRRFLVILAGVPDFWLSQFGLALWHVPAFMTRALCLDIRDLPTSCTIQNPSDVYINVNLDHLFPSIMPIGQKHILVKEKPEVIQSITSFIQGIA